MTTGEKEPRPIFTFSGEITEGLLQNLEGEAKRTGSLRVAIARWIEEEGSLFRDLVRKHFPKDKERKIAVDEYGLVGSLILETDSLLKSGLPEEMEESTKERIALLTRYPWGFDLLVWWVSQTLEEFEERSPEERLAAFDGRVRGALRYMFLYRALVKRGVPSDGK